MNTKVEDWQQRIHLEISNDVALCTRFANDSYFVAREVRNLGVRSIGDEIDTSRNARLNEKWLEGGDSAYDDMNRYAILQFRTEVQQSGQNEEQIRESL
jgi:hypothetical protein